jgi:hypothetical protein
LRAEDRQHENDDREADDCRTDRRGREPRDYPTRLISDRVGSNHEEPGKGQREEENSSDELNRRPDVLGIERLLVQGPLPDRDRLRRLPFHPPTRLPPGDPSPQACGPRPEQHHERHGHFRLRLERCGERAFNRRRRLVRHFKQSGLSSVWKPKPGDSASRRQVSRPRAPTRFPPKPKVIRCRSRVEPPRPPEHPRRDRLARHEQARHAEVHRLSDAGGAVNERYRVEVASPKAAVVAFGDLAAYFAGTNPNRGHLNGHARKSRSPAGSEEMR